MSISEKNMATPQLSPGVVVREVDLTVGRADNVLANIGAIAGPFKFGPVEEAIDITTEQDLINTFGKPLSTDRQYEYWLSASSFLSYGGVLKVARADGATLNNANAGAPIGGVGIASTSNIKIKNYDDYQGSYTDITSAWTWAAKDPGTWANNLKVCFIDDVADQTVGFSTVDLNKFGFAVGTGVTWAYSGTTAGIGTTATENGYVKGIITGVATNTSTTEQSTIDVKIVSRVQTTGAGATETAIDYAQFNPQSSIAKGNTLFAVSSSGINTDNGSGLLGASLITGVTTVSDWYNNQTLNLTNSTVYWKQIASKPTTSRYSEERSGRNDTMHVVVVDDDGSVTGIQGSILEKSLFLSKGSNTVSDTAAPERSYYKDFIAQQSSYLYPGFNASSATDSYFQTEPKATGFTTYSGVKSQSFTAIGVAGGLWGQETQGVIFNALGNVTYPLGGGVDYAASGGTEFKATLGSLVDAYDLFSNSDEVDVNYLIMGPGCGAQDESQAKANKLIAIAEQRKDCVAVISPHRSNVVNVAKGENQTNNVVEFFSPLNASSYAIFDSGYKYTYDRFNNKFVYLPCNADVAGLMVRTEIEAYPWFSPAGQQRGVLNNAIKLAYNPKKAQRDTLYESRINSIINQSGTGILLFGDKTALNYASAFDRINVRRLFLTVEKALESVANAQLFEFNDEITRANFSNVVEPYLRDVQAKRGLIDFRVICDETNNTPSVVDNNEFRADIFLKPTKSINFVTLTFVATRTGVSFEEVTGRV
jgi:hypothetical protein